MTTKIITFDHIAGAECRYARAPVAPYGTIGTGPRKQRLTAEARAALESAISELSELHPWGAPRYIVSAGAMVPMDERRGPRDPHVRGLAYDIDSLWWTETHGPSAALVTLEAPKEWRHYISIQCILARWFGVCLGFDYNAAHHDHWHVDTTRPVEWRGGRSDNVLVQRALNEIWDEDLEVDGKMGPITSVALEQCLVKNGLVSWAMNPDWRDWLLATAKKGLEGL